MQSSSPKESPTTTPSSEEKKAELVVVPTPDEQYKKYLKLAKDTLQKAPKLALKSLEKALEIKQNDKDALILLASTYYYLNEDKKDDATHEKLLSLLRQVISLCPPTFISDYPNVSDETNLEILMRYHDKQKFIESFTEPSNYNAFICSAYEVFTSHFKSINHPLYLTYKNKEVDAFATHPSFFPDAIRIKVLIIEQSKEDEVRVQLAEEILEHLNKHAIKNPYHVGVNSYCKIKAYMALKEYLLAKKELFFALDSPAFNKYIAESKKTVEIAAIYATCLTHIVHEDPQYEELKSFFQCNETDNPPNVLNGEWYCAIAQAATKLKLLDFASREYGFLEWLMRSQGIRMSKKVMGDTMIGFAETELLKLMENLYSEYINDLPGHYVAFYIAIRMMSSQGGLFSQPSQPLSAFAEIKLAKENCRTDNFKQAELHILQAFRKAEKGNMILTNAIINLTYYYLITNLSYRASIEERKHPERAIKLYELIKRIQGDISIKKNAEILTFAKNRVHKLKNVVQQQLEDNSQEKQSELSKALSAPVKEVMEQAKPKQTKAKNKKHKKEMKQLPPSVIAQSESKQPIEAVHNVRQFQDVLLSEPAPEILSRVPELHIKLPPLALDALKRLTKSGATRAYCVGGLVCEAINNLDPEKKESKNDKPDIDLVFGCSTDKAPLSEQEADALIQSAFKDIAEKISSRKGIYKIILKNVGWASLSVPTNTTEATIDIFYSQLLSEPNITDEEALKRDSDNRDFTMNALYADIDGQVYDPLKRGLSDLKEKLLKSIKACEYSFKFDPIRIFRAVYFYTKRECRLSEHMKKIIVEAKPEIFSELIKNEPSKINVWLMKLLTFGNGEANFKELMELNLFTKFHPLLAKFLNESPDNRILILKNLASLDTAYNKTQKSLNINQIYAFWIVLIAHRRGLKVEDVETADPLFKANFESLMVHFKDEPAIGLKKKKHCFETAQGDLACLILSERAAKGTSVSTAQSGMFGVQPSPESFVTVASSLRS